MDIGNHPAFPCEAQGDRGVPQEHDYVQTGIYTSKFPGLTIRDWFAGQALSGILSGGFADTIPHDDINGGAGAAHFAYLYADAMLAARKQEQG